MSSCRTSLESGTPAKCTAFHSEMALDIKAEAARLRKIMDSTIA